jgi:hypothetical protein
MDGPTVSVAASGKLFKAFIIVALCFSVAGTVVGLIDLSGGYHRLQPTCFCAGSVCYLANILRPNRWWLIFGVPLWITAIWIHFIK